MATAHKSPSLPLRQWILWPAAVGFVVGFLAPVLLDPEANLGPMLGMVVTGPGGALAGLVLGIVARLLHLPLPRQQQVLGAACVTVAVASLYFCLPEPAWRGEVLDAQVAGCRRPAEALDRAVAHYEKLAAGRAARPGWQQDLRRTAESDAGVVLELEQHRRNQVFEHRKPWNEGVLFVTGWQDVNGTRRYYSGDTGGSCAGFPIGTDLRRYAYYPPAAPDERVRKWPHTSNLPRFLDLRIVEPVPENIERLIAESDGE